MNNSIYSVRPLGPLSRRNYYLSRRNYIFYRVLTFAFFIAIVAAGELRVIGIRFGISPSLSDLTYYGTLSLSVVLGAAILQAIASLLSLYHIPTATHLTTARVPSTNITTLPQLLTFVMGILSSGLAIAFFSAIALQLIIRTVFPIFLLKNLFCAVFIAIAARSFFKRLNSRRSTHDDITGNANKTHAFRSMQFVPIATLILISFVWLSDSTEWAHNFMARHIVGLDPTHLPRTIFVNGEPMQTTTIAGRDFQVPRRYLGFGLRPQNETGILLHAALPDMTSFDYDEEIKMDRGRTLIILVTDESSTTSFQFRYGVIRNRYSVLSDLGTAYGLHHYKSSKGDIGKSLDDYDPSIPREQLQADFYVDNDVTPTIYISCAGDREGPRPQCALYSLDNGLLYDIDFDKRYIAEWSSIHSKTVALVESFVVHRSAISTH